jgi:hypothetical protein
VRLEALSSLFFVTFLHQSQKNAVEAIAMAKMAKEI